MTSSTSLAVSEGPQTVNTRNIPSTSRASLTVYGVRRDAAMQVPAPREDEPEEPQRTKAPPKCTVAATAERPAEPDRLLRLRSVLDIIPVSKSTFYSGIAAGRFPRTVKLGRNSFWRLSEILSVIEGGTK